MKRIFSTLLALAIAVVATMSITILAFAEGTDSSVNNPPYYQSENGDGEVLAGLTPVNPLLRTATYEITGDGVRVRSGPGTSYSIVGLLYSGTLVTASHSEDTVYANGYEWRHVWNSSIGGWVATAYITEVG